MNDWVEIGRLENIPRRGARCVNTPAGKIAVFRTAEDRVFAIDDRCPHRGGPLSQGIVHGAQDEGSVRTFQLEVLDGRILMAADAMLAAAE
jgi:nitrite reductase (NADH) small subunit